MTEMNQPSDNSIQPMPSETQKNGNAATYKLRSFNLELTTKCPLRCPQCYCSLDGGKDLSRETAIRIIKEAAELGAEHVELSGGETLCYPYLLDLIHASRENGIIPYIAVSGWNFNEKTIENLREAGVGGVFVSINAPTAALNAITRDGFDYAIHALETLSAVHYENTYVNWVMHRDTADTLPQMIQLVEPYHIKGIVILAPKPDASHKLNSYPTIEQMESVSSLIHSEDRAVNLFVESCFSPLLALAGRNPFWGNQNRGIDKGCGAGLLNISVNVDGLFSPCRHLDYFERFDSLKDYWNKSKVLQKIRALQNDYTENCMQCEFCMNCRPCLAINAKLHEQLCLGNEKCLLYQKYPGKSEP